MAGPLEGKVALVTGGAGGIGRAAAVALSGAGARVAVAGRDLAALEGVLLPDGSRPLPVHLDVRDAGSWERAVATVVAALGRLDLLVHNAGIVQVGPLERLEPEALRDVLDTNLLGALLGTRAALPALRATGGAVVHVASLGGVVPMPYEAAYAATKAGLRQLSFSLRAELAGSGVSVTVVTPDSTQTAQLERELAHDEAALSFANEPLDPAEVGRGILRAALGRAPEVLVPRLGGVAARLAAAFPRLWDRLVPLLRWWGARRMARLRRGRGGDPG
jgi:NAD(P)-dependent dehydrogenase (short-subunit alcohol dehydrogenase family)